LKQKILIVGLEITKDKRLLNLLQPKADLSLVEKIEHLESSIRKELIDLVVCELSEDCEKDIRIIKEIKKKQPNIFFIIVNGGENMNVIISALHAGSDDYFKKPFKVFLLAERIEAFLKSKN